MGCFTFTDARRKPKINKDGNYANQDKIGYGGFAKIVCPDNSEIKESYYEGYGDFDGHDIYDLVVDWNKDHLDAIFNKISSLDPNHFGRNFHQAAVYYQHNDMDNLYKEITRLVDTGLESPIIKEEWKRYIGITISCGTCDNIELNDLLPYPIKITSTKWHRTYDELVPSYNCQ